MSRGAREALGSWSAIPYPLGWEGVTVTGFRVLGPSLLAGGAVVVEPRHPGLACADSDQPGEKKSGFFLRIGLGT